MEIILKKKTPAIKEMLDNEGKKINMHILSVYFDVLTDDTAYVDDDDIGYFPIEIVADMNTPDKDIIEACENWIVDNNVLDVYTGIDIDEYMITKKEKDINRGKAIAELAKDGYIFKEER